MNKTFLAFVLFFLSLALSCKDMSQRKSVEDSNIDIRSEKECFDRHDKVKILLKILNSEAILYHTDPRVKAGNLSYKILESDLMRDLKMMAYGQPIQVLDSLEATADTFRISILEVVCQEALEFRVLYPIEGKWYARGTAKKINDIWEATITSGGIAD